MTKQDLFQNRKDGCISGNLLMQLIKTISTALGARQQGPPPGSTPALLLPKGKGFPWAKTCPVFLLPTRPHFWTLKWPAQMVPSPVPGPTPASFLVLSPQG